MRKLRYVGTVCVPKSLKMLHSWIFSKLMIHFFTCSRSITSSYHFRALWNFLFIKTGDFSVSLKAPGRNKHFRVHVENGMYCIGQRKFISLQQLVDHYQVGLSVFYSREGVNPFFFWGGGGVTKVNDIRKKNCHKFKKVATGFYL